MWSEQGRGLLYACLWHTICDRLSPCLSVATTAVVAPIYWLYCIYRLYGTVLAYFFVGIHASLKSIQNSINLFDETTLPKLFQCGVCLQV